MQANHISLIFLQYWIKYFTFVCPSFWSGKHFYDFIVKDLKTLVRTHTKKIIRISYLRRVAWSCRMT